MPDHKVATLNGKGNEKYIAENGSINSESRRSRRKEIFENVLEWSELTNIHGTYYVFEQNVRLWSTVFWTVIWIFLFGASFYMIAMAYLNWANNPVLTTVSTTALPIKEIEFPVITICGLGTIKEMVEIAYLKQVVQYLSNNGINVDVTPNTTADDLLTTYGFDFIHENYPGATLSPVEMVAAMTTQNPNEQIRAEIVVNGGYNTCNVGLYGNLTSNENETSYNICDNMAQDPNTQNCYELSRITRKQHEAYDICWDKKGYMFYPLSDDHLLGLIKLIEEGPLSILKNGLPFWVDLTKGSDGAYTLLDGEKLKNTTFVYLNLTESEIVDPLKRCFVLSYNEETRGFIGNQSACTDSYDTMCYASFPIACNETNGNATGRVKAETSLLDKLLNPKIRPELNKEVTFNKKKFYKAFHSLNITKAYSKLFDLLWYSQLPCYDVNGYFDFPYQRSLLKECKWKGINIPCSAIFNTVPTDRGMCCTFNMKAAEYIFYQTKYQTKVSELQKWDNENSYQDSRVPDWYLQGNEPISQHGINRGLSITIDAHSDLIGSSTVSEDYQGFIAIINDRNGYPVANQESIQIRPGHDTLVALSAVDVQANLENMSVKDRQCHYSNGKKEEELLKMHRNYSQTTCILECQIIYAMDKMPELGEEPCIPWYLPTLNNDTKMCNPWSAVAFSEQMMLTPDDKCEHCLTDCQSTIYTHFVSTVPFRRCDGRNHGISHFCNIDDKNLPDPPIFGHQVRMEYNHTDPLPDYIDSIKTNMRSYEGLKDDIFQESLRPDTEYDAYENDIAVVHFYFESPTIFQYTRSPKMTWIDFISQVGGLLGLCLGFSICMIIEVVYWVLIRLWFDVTTDKNKDV